ncbi:hypothetical protein CEXT_140311 [Caerostris extrusa]|uniref:Uncharacterized protein n=1 Tax=Caerostris extrusa TaxID=172846 RepID=A0AAV4XM27_CAEEX|nr:hypothetical protein CEXT_140311 [Caerostris extrusa]
MHVLHAFALQFNGSWHDLIRQALALQEISLAEVVPHFLWSDQKRVTMKAELDHLFFPTAGTGTRRRGSAQVTDWYTDF